MIMDTNDKMNQSIKQQHREVKKNGQKVRSDSFQLVESYWNNVVNEALKDIPNDVIKVIMHKADPAKKKLLF